VASKRRDWAAVTAKRGECALDEAEVRREACWYGRLGAWKAAEGEGGAEMVGECEVSMLGCARAKAVEEVARSWRRPKASC